jgi:uncharacterized protein with beta-barrel porin domain
VTLKARLLTSVFVLPLSGWLMLAPASAFDVTGDEADAEATTEQIILEDTDTSDVQSIIIDGTPSNPSEQAALLIRDDQVVTVNGTILVRDRDDDGELTPLQNGIAVKVGIALSAGELRLKSGANLSVLEIQGPEYDGDEDGLPDANDTDEDGIVEGPLALGGAKRRIGVWVAESITGNLIGESGSSIRIEGMGGTDASNNIIAGILLQADLIGNLDLSTRIDAIGDNARGVNINNTIDGNYRQRGDIDVRGEGGVGIDLDGAITGSLLIESLVNATGYSTAPTPQRGVDESELTADESNANANERRRGGSAIDVAANVSGGILINGSLNTIQTPSETQALADIAEARTDDDGNLVDITAQKTLPFHFDANRASGRVTTYGEASGEAALKISSTIGSLTGSTLETFLDTTNDDGEAVPEEDTDPQLDVYDSTREFFYSHGLMNRGTIAANSWYDGFKADAVRVEAGATIHGGIYNSGSISATAYNGDATALGLNAGALNDGLRSDSSILLNEGTISASVTTHTGSDSTKTKSSNTATAIVLADGVAPAGGLILNRGTIFASSNHITAATDDAAATSVVGEHAIALDVSAVTSALHITQSMRQADALLSSGANSNTNPYLNGGDLDIDRTGNIGENDDGNAINIADGKIDTRDIAAPSITGEIRFGSGANEFRLLAGTMTGNIDFAGGADDLFIGNSMEDDANSEDDFEDNEYTAPITSFSGTIENGASSDLTLTLGGQTAITAEKTRLHFIGQEGRDLNDDGDDGDLGEEFEGLDITSLTLSEKADLRFTIDPTFLSGAVLDVTNLTVGTDATISPFITRLPGLDADGNPEARVLTLIESSSDLSSLSSTINDNLLEDGHPYIYNVSLAVDETGTKDAIAATFALKEASELGLNKTEGAAWPAVISHFGTNETLEARLSAITDGDDFVAYYDQLLPQHGDGTMKQLASLGEAATGAVGQHLQIVAAGARRDGDGWLQQFGDYRKQDGTVETDTVSGTSYGLAIGYDAPASFTEALGLYAQMSFTSVNEKPSLLPNGLAPNRNEVKAESFGVGAYLADALGPVRYELSAAAGSIAFDSVRGVQFNGLSDVLSAAWDGTSTSASARIIYPILEDDHLLRVEAGRDYFSLEQDDYTEQTAFLVDPELALRVRGGSSDMTSDYVGIRGSLVRGGGSPSDIVWEPNYYLGWRSVAEYSPYSAKANFVGNDTEFDLTSQDEISDSTELGLGLAAHNDYFAFEFNYRGKFGDGEEVHGGGISVRLLF